ncbi:MAG: ATP-binding protein [Candidatus Sungbacteria bacterium]|nr:ATP-binding protein [Candidatus Sungbacteria bacterium]
MKIYLPHSAFLGNIDPFLAAFDPSHKEKLEITANKNWIFVHPVVLAMVAALGLTVYRKNIKCEKIVARSGHYLERMGLFKFLDIKSGMKITEHDPSGRFVPLTQIKTSEQLTKFLTEMIPLLHLEPRHAEPIKYIISELVRNVLEHARAPQGAIVSAQYHAKNKTIRIGIVDRGSGIKSTINQSWDASNDLEAIKLALMPGVTGTTKREGGTEQNAGAGLFFIKSIAYVNRNFFMIYSGNAMYKLLKRSGAKKIMLHANPNLDRHSERNNLPYWDGTAVGVDISLDTTQEFTALLDLIRDTYSEAVKERKRNRYKRAKFI